MQSDALTICVAIATAGRPEILARTLAVVLNQSLPPARILVCPADPKDLPDTVMGTDSAVTVVQGDRGLPAQRNALIAAEGEADLVVFFDDDFFPERSYLEETAALFRDHPEIVMATGEVLKDGILGPGLTPEEALAILAEAGPSPNGNIQDVHNGYGCNMVVRMSAVRALKLRFDEMLPLYGWLEDVDFSRQLAPAGRIVHSPRLRGVHLGNKKGRSSGLRLGYSQVANPIYMVRKGTLARRRAYAQIWRNVVANATKTLRPEPWVDRKGRLRGNVLAGLDVFRGRLDPRRILSL